MSKTPTITQSDLDEIMEDCMMSNPTGYCTTCEELVQGVAEPDAENYECQLCGERTLHGAIHIVDLTTFGGLRVVD